MRRRALLASPALWPAFSPTMGHAQTWPSRPITVIVPFTAGGPSDIFGRAIAAAMQPKLGQPGVVENRAGAGGAIAAGFVARAAPDGLTLMVTAGGIMTISPLLKPDLPYDPIRDFAPITLGIRAPNVLVVPAASPITSLAGFVAAARAEPGAITYSTPGIGASEHLTMAMLAQRAGVELTHVPYPGAAPAVTDLLSGTVKAGFLGLGATLAHIQGGKLRPLAVSSAERDPALPEVRAVAETYPGFLAHSWQGLVAPRGTPEPILERLHALAAESLADPTTRGRLQGLGFTVVASSRAGMAEAIVSETERWRRVIVEAHIVAG